MHFRVRDPDPDGKFLSQLRLELLAQVFPYPAVAALLAPLPRENGWQIAEQLGERTPVIS